MGKWTRQTRMVNGGKPGVYTMERSPLEIAVVSVLLAASLGFGGWLTVSQIQLGRELSTMGGDLRSIHAELAMRVVQRDREHSELVQADLDAAKERALIVETLHRIELRSAMYAETSQTNQEHALGILDKMPEPKEKRR